MNFSLLQARRVIGSFCVSAAVLAIANVETIWQEYHRAEIQESGRDLRYVARWRPQKAKVSNLKLPEDVRNPQQTQFNQSLKQDELNDENPFDHLGNLDPLKRIIALGIVKFRRETFRSPDYQQESGYDLLSYSVSQADGSHSTILAYLDRPELNTWHNVGAPDVRIPFVAIVIGGGEQSSYNLYRNGELIEQSLLPGIEAEAIVSHKLSQGVPFMSVSR